MGGHARASTEEKHVLSPIRGPTAVSVVHRETVVKRQAEKYVIFSSRVAIGTFYLSSDYSSLSQKSRQITPYYRDLFLITFPYTMANKRATFT